MKKSLLFFWVSFIIFTINVSAQKMKTSAQSLVRQTNLNRYKLNEFDQISSFKEGLAVVVKNEKFGFINKNGIEVIPCKYEQAISFSEGLAAVTLNGKTGFINKTGEIAIQFNYNSNYGYAFHEGLVNVCISDESFNEKWFFIDKTGRIVLDCQKYSGVEIFSEGLALVEMRGRVGFINNEGVEVVSCKYDDPNSNSFNHLFKEGLCRVKKYGKYGFIDKSGIEMSPTEFDFAENFSNGLALIKQNNSYFYINNLGNKVIDGKEFWTMESFSEGFAVVEIKFKYGYIDKTGQLVIPVIYDNAYEFNEGLAVVGINEKFGFIDKSGKIIVPIIFDSADNFSEGVAMVVKDGKKMFIDKIGKVVLE